MVAVATRREAARRALALGGTTLAAAALPKLLRPPAAGAKQDSESGILVDLIERAQTGVVAYRTAAGGDLLDKEVAKAARFFSDQEQAHADALIAALEDMGGNAPKPPTASEIEGLDEPSSQKEMLEFLIEMEQAAIGAYGDAAERLLGPDLLKTGAEIVSNEAQHLVVLRQQLGEDPLPVAFVTGA